MLLFEISLTDFRSYQRKNFRFTSGLTIMIGPNASGKTNILEAIFLLSTGKSFRAEQDREMIGWGKEIGRVSSKITQLSNNPINQLISEKKDLEIVLTTGIVGREKVPFKKFSINGVGKRMLDFVGNLKVVLFWPEDLELVTDSPSLRRRYLDFVLTQIDREYRRTIISYEKGLRQRNKLLEAIREGRAHHHQLIFWDQLLIKDGGYISKKREEYIDYINSAKLKVQSAKLPDYNLVYGRSVISETRLAQYKEEEVAAGVTLVGPHRDNFQFSIYNFQTKTTRDLSRYGSRGEQRLAILWLKLGELAYIEKIADDKPLLLLDDIFSELDHEHRKIIFEVIGNQQTIMTTTDLHFIEKNRLGNGKIIEI